MSEVRWRMQSVRTGWGVEAPYNEEGRKHLEEIRKKQKDKFKYCRVYKMLQMTTTETEFFVPFELTFGRQRF